MVLIRADRRGEESLGIELAGVEERWVGSDLAACFLGLGDWANWRGGVIVLRDLFSVCFDRGGVGRGLFWDFFLFWVVRVRLFGFVE